MPLHQMNALDAQLINHHKVYDMLLSNTLTHTMALGKALHTWTEFWLNLRLDWDLQHAMGLPRNVAPQNKLGQNIRNWWREL